MKEFLDPNDNYKFHKISIGDAPHWMIEIPDGADVLIRLNSGLSAFYKDNFKKVWDLGIWCSTSNAENFKDKCRLWERKSMKEYIDESEIIKGECSIKGNLSVEGTLAERQKSYGCFEDVATVTEEVIKALRIANYDNMPKPHKMAMYMIASKMARLVNGDFNHLDSWHDIGGYSKLIEKLIGGENE